jgi:hypothetical protein
MPYTLIWGTLYHEVRRYLSVMYFELRHRNLNKTNTLLVTSRLNFECSPQCPCVLMCRHNVPCANINILLARSAGVKRGNFHCTGQVNGLNLCNIVQLLHRMVTQDRNVSIYRDHYVYFKSYTYKHDLNTCVRLGAWTLLKPSGNNMSHLL